MKKDNYIRIISSENDPIFKNALNRVFQQWEANILFASRGEKLLEHYFNSGADILVISLDSGDLTGTEIVEYIRNQANDSDAYIIVTILSGENEERNRILNQGADDYILKPFSAGGEEVVARLNVAKRHVMLFKQVLIAYNRLSREFDTVSSLQHKLLPKDRVTFPRLYIDSFYEPSGRASGDYFDFFPLDNKRLRVAIADVSGHGARAAFVMAMVRSLVRASTIYALSPHQLVQLINKELCEVIGEDMDFVTLFLGDIDVEEKTLCYVNAAHCPAILMGEKGQMQLLESNFSVLGFFNQDFESTSLSLHGKRGLLLYTDGYYEWNLDRDTIWGLGNFLQLVTEVFKHNRVFYLEMLDEAIIQEIGAPPMYRDDRSSLWIKFKWEEEEDVPY